MNNIRVKQKPLNDWRSELIEESNCDCNCGEDPCVKCGGNCHDLDEGLASKLIKVGAGVWAANKAGKWIKKKGDAALDDARKNMKIGGDKRKSDIEKATGVKLEHVEGGISVQNVADGLNFTEVETVDIIKPEPIKGASNWQLEMAVESLISEGYNDEDIVTILTEELPKIPLAPIVTGAFKGAWNLSTRGVKGAYDLGKGVRSVVNRGAKDTKLTKDILSTAKKLRNPDGVSIIKSPSTNASSKGGGLLKSFKGFMKNVKDSTGNLANRTKEKLTRINNSRKAEVVQTAKDVDVLGGAATNPSTKIKPMKNITPSSIGDKITGVTGKMGGGAAAVTAGIVAGSKLTSKSPSKVTPAAPITNDSKTEQPTKRELRNQRNDALSSKEGRRERRDARVKNKISGNRPTGKTKWVGKNTTWKDRYGNVIAPKVTEAFGGYKGGTIINPSGSRNKFGLPDSIKSIPGGIKEVPLTPSQNRLLVKKDKKTKVG